MKIGLHAYRRDEEDDNNEMDYERSIIDLAKNLPNLEEFSLRSIVIVENTLFEFLRFGIHWCRIHWCRIIINNELILRTSNILKINRQQGSEPLTMFINPADSIDLTVRRTDEVKRQLELSSRCKNFGYLKQ